MDDIRQITTLLDIKVLLGYLAILMTIGVLALLTIVVLLVFLRVGIIFEIVDPDAPKDIKPESVRRRLRVVSSGRNPTAESQAVDHRENLGGHETA